MAWWSETVHRVLYMDYAFLDFALFSYYRTNIGTSYLPIVTGSGCGLWLVATALAFLFLTRMFIFTIRFSVTPTCNHDHLQLVCITPADGRVKGVP